LHSAKPASFLKASGLPAMKRIDSNFEVKDIF